MIETYLLEYLATLERNKTLSDAAKHLFVTQSALSRSMQKLEKILGVELFIRKKNSIALNDNGKLFAKYAEEILTQINNSIESVREFNRKKRTISIGSCAPIPLNQIIFLMTNYFPDITLTSELNNDAQLLNGLQNNFFNIVILHQNFIDEKFLSEKIGGEQLFLSVPPNHKFADKDGIFLEELNGEKILLYSKIGFWYEICKEKAPNAKFLLQTEREIFKELVESNSFLSFTTNIFIENNRAPKNCFYKPILNVEADVTYYFVCRLNQKKRFKELIETLKTSNFKTFSL